MKGGRAKTAKPLPCPCGSADYAACCGRYHNGAPAPDALALMKLLAIRLGHQRTMTKSLVMMRSRYSAYALKLEAYLLASRHDSTRPAALDLATDNTKWTWLEIRKRNAESADRATVEFVARYKSGGRAARLHEVSRFVREGGRWFYLDGEFAGPA